MDYLLATAADVPPMTVDRIESPSIDAVGGFRGVGEGGVIGLGGSGDFRERRLCRLRSPR